MIEAGNKLTQGLERKLIDHFYRPEFVVYRYLSLERNQLIKEDFIKEINRISDIIIGKEDCDQFKPIYNDLKDKIVTSCNFSTNSEGRSFELEKFVRDWSVEFFKSQGVTTFSKPFICDPSCFEGDAPPIASRSTIVCSDFAFLQLAEKHAYSKFFMDMSDQPFKEILKEWGYDLVDSPQPGDLVVYFNHEQAEHFGVWNHNGNVVSKWGAGPVHEHPLHLVLKIYGDNVVFYRKPLFKEILDELASHPEDSVQDFCQNFKKLITSKQQTCHKHSFAHYFFNEWGKQFFEISETFSNGITINQAIETLEKIAKGIPFDISRCA